MNSKYDIYKRLPGDRLVWVNRVKELDDARLFVSGFESSSKVHYLVYDFRAREVVEVFGQRPQDSAVSADRMSVVGN
jgi:hypothetical protein